MRQLLMAMALTAVVALPAAAAPLPEEDLGEMAAGRQRLALMAAPEVRARFPELLARAEFSFDCWTLNPEGRMPDGDFAACRGAFMAAMHQLETQVAAAARGDLAATH